MASMLSRDINGATAFWETLGTGFSLAILYRILGRFACRSHRFGVWIKGEPQVIVDGGKMQAAAMTRHNVSEHDLHEELRLNGGINEIQQVKIACIERNGQISVQRKPQIFNVSVEKGIQTVQIQIF